MGRYTITQAQWFALAEQYWSASKVREYRQRLADNSSAFRGDGLPMIEVTWDDAQAFCDLLNQNYGVAGLMWRLPTEAEWEYGCRAGTETPFAFGETITPQLANYDWSVSSYRDNGPTAAYLAHPTPVGQFPANGWGLSDMHGNVWEWCLDQYSDNYNSKSNAMKSNGSIILPYSNINDYRVLRGGSWIYFPWDCRSAFRIRFSRVNFFNCWGFRLVLASRTS